MDDKPHIPTDLLARTVGMVMFLAGLVLLVVVFVLTYRMFAALGSRAAIRGLEIKAVGVAGVRVLLLFVMGYLASLISTKGIQLYGVGRGIATTR